jgi:arylsulfatase A-like enzyme
MSSTTNLGLRAGKGSAYEGGVRVPLIFSLPARIKPGTTSDTPGMSIDLLPTLVDLCGLAMTETPAWDGVSLSPVLLGTGKLPRDTLYWHYPHYHPGGATPYGAVRAGNWRLVEFYEDDRVELYNLEDDPAESRDLAASEPARRDELLAQLRDWRQEVGAQMPTPNPDFDPERNRAPAKAKGGKAKGKQKR